MVRNVVVAVLLLGCAACASAPPPPGPAPFAVLRSDARNGDETRAEIRGQNNRISSKSVAGGAHADRSGLFLDPFVSRDAGSGELRALGLALLNTAYHDVSAGAPNALGLPKRVSFLLDGAESLVLPVEDAAERWTESAASGASLAVLETGTVALSAAQCARILAAKSVAVTVTGSKRTAVYQATDIAPAFIENLRSVFNQPLPGARPTP